MDARKREIRTIESKLALREASQNAQGESRTITGTAIVFNRESQLLDEHGEKFREIILPEAATMAFLNTQDVKLNLLHERELTIARCNKGDANASLRLSVDANGVNFEFDAPRCDLGDRALELVRTGVYTGCSFEFYPKDYEKKVDGKDVTIIHRTFDAITGLTIGLDPAYMQTSVNVREIIEKECGDKRDEDEKEPETPEDEKKDAETKHCEDTEKCEDTKHCEDDGDEMKPEDKQEREQQALRAYERRQLELQTRVFQNNY